MKLKKVKQGSTQNVGNPYFGRETITRTEEVARRHLRTNNYSKKGSPDEPMIPGEDAEGVRVFPRSGL